ncbi:MAG: hypothetical protein JSV19_05975 [Phycisphaerales bacterium]|nr:MAG: hypothetical protein JSV19_05975 [Phycisphaerales bacterium]
MRTVRFAWLMGGLAVALWCSSVATGDEVAQPWGTVHADLSGSSSSNHPSMIFNTADWAFGAEVAWTIDLVTAGIGRPYGKTSIVFDEVGNLYWKSNEPRVISVDPSGSIRWVGNDGAGGNHYLGLGATDTPVVGDGGTSGRVYALGNTIDADSGFVVAYNKSDGAIAWQTNLPGANFEVETTAYYGGFRLTPVLYNGKLYIMGMWKYPGTLYLYQVDSATGVLDWSAPINNNPLPYPEPGVKYGTYSQQMTLIPDVFGAGKHGLYFNRDRESSANDGNSNMYCIEIDTGLSTASLKWQGFGGYADRSHVNYLPDVGRVCTATWTDWGASFYCWDLDGANPVEYLNTVIQADPTAWNAGQLTSSGHGYYDVVCADFDGNDVLAGGFSGQVVRYKDIDVGTNGPADDKYYQLEWFWGEPRAIGGLYQDSEGNSIFVSGSNSRAECDTYPPGTPGGCVGETGYEAHVFAADLTNAPELLDCTLVDDGAAYIDNFTITGGPTAGSQTTILDVAGFESYPLGDITTNANPGGTGTVLWDPDMSGSANGPVQVVDDPNAINGHVLKLDAYQGCYDYQGISARVNTTTDNVVIVSWDQYREDLWDNLYMDEDPARDGWYAIQWDIQEGITPSGFDEPFIDLTAGQWQHVEYKFDFVLWEVTVTIDASSNGVGFLDPYSDPANINGFAWNLEGGEYTMSPAAQTIPIFQYNTGSVYDHSYTLRGGPLLGPTVGEAEQHIYYFKTPRQELGNPYLVALRGIGQLIDCNSNGVPDSQDIAGGTSDDCNANNVPDECDIADGTSQDTNVNGVPDECEDLEGPVAEVVASYKVHGTAPGDSLTIEMDQQINLDPGSDPQYDAIYAISDGTITFVADPDGWTRMNLTGGGYFYGPEVDLVLAGYGPIAVAGGGTIEFDARYYNDPTTNSNPYADAPIFVEAYSADGYRDYSMVYQTGGTDIGWYCAPLAQYPSWVHVIIDVDDMLGDPNCDGTPDVVDVGDFDPTAVTRIRFRGTDWYGSGDDFLDIKNLVINTDPYPNNLGIEVYPSSTESRQAGPTEVVVEFDEDVYGVGGASIDDVTVSSGSVTNITTNGNELTIELTGTTDGQMLTIGFPGIKDELGNVSTDSVTFGVLLGDAEGDMDVDLADFSLFQQCFTAVIPVGAECASSDFVNDGDVDLANDYEVFEPAMTGPSP